MPRRKAEDAVPKKRIGIDAINKLIEQQEHAEEFGPSDEAKVHVGKQDVNEMLGKKRTGLPRAIKSAGGKVIAEPIRIAPPQQKYGELVLVGISPLITNCWSWKTIQGMLRKHMQLEQAAPKATRKPKDKDGNLRDAKNPYDIFINSLYEHVDGGYGFPSNGIKKSAVSACSFNNGIAPKYVSGAVTVHGELSQILGTPKARFDMVTVTDKYGKQSPDTRFRAEFKDWAVVLKISYASSIITDVDVFNLFLWAGATIGIGEWRKEKDGNNGMFNVLAGAAAEDIKKRLKVADRKKMNEENSGVQEILERYKVFEIEAA